MERGFVMFRLPAAILIICFTMFITMSSTFASGNLWYDKYVALESSIGNNYYNSIDSSTLGWGESYVLRSYINMYNLSKSTSWLDKFTTHVDTMLSNTNDSDGDGYQGWDTYVYSPVELDNTGFETGSPGDSTLPDQWIRFQSDSSTAYRTTEQKYNGSYGLVIKTNGTLWQKLYQPMNNYEPGTKYNFRVYAKTNGSAAKGRAYVHDRTTGQILADIPIDTTNWTYFSVEFMTPSEAGHNIEIWLGHQYYNVIGGEAYFDDVKISARYPYLVHDGMIGYAMAEFVKLVNKTPSLQTAYQTKANTYKNFIENNIVSKWENSTYLGNCWRQSGSEGYYIFPPNMATISGEQGTIAPFNMQLVVASMLMTMYDVNGNSTYLDKAKRINTYWKNRLVNNGTAYKWYYRGSSGTIEDTSHGMLDISSALEMFWHGQVFNGTDMEKFTDTLTEYMWNKSLTSPIVYAYVDGTGGTSYTRNLVSWIRLSQFDDRAWTIAAEQFRNYTPQSLFELNVLSQIMEWDPVKLVNQGFELKSSSDSTLPARWVRWQSTSSTAYLDSTNKSSGDYGLTIKANGTLWQKLYQVWNKWEPSSTYVVTFDGKTDGTAAGGQIVIRNETTATVLATYSFSNTSWQTMTFTFTSPANPTDTVRIYLGNNDYTITDGKAHYDNISIKKLGDSW